jgi:spore coat polysaccharide biosynthesis predicted glycosyltransferase SpsG
MVAALDTEASVKFPTRLVINPLLGPEKRAYKAEGGTQLLLGGRYSIVRSIFRRQRQVRIMEPQPPYRAILAFGDDDFAGQSLQRAKELLEAGVVDRLSVIVRSHHHQWQELKQLASESGGKMELLSELNELSTRLTRAHFVVTSGDNWSLEMACVGIPQLVISQNPRQALNGRLLDSEGAANYLGSSESVTHMNLRDAVANLLDDQLERMGMSRCGRQLIDGRGPDRIVNALEIMVRATQRFEAERIAA